MTCRTPAAEGSTNIPEWKFDAVRAAILDALADGPILNKDLKDKVGARMDATTLETLGKLGWHVVTVKLELEVRGEVERLKGSPLRIQKAAP